MTDLKSLKLYFVTQKLFINSPFKTSWEIQNIIVISKNIFYFNEKKLFDMNHFIKSSLNVDKKNETAIFQFPPPENKTEDAKQTWTR